jgi:tRNA threonylcarbamoyladenosine biosynthesis protein TsaB
MITLVIDTALSACTAAVCAEGRVLGLRSEVMARGHSERLGGFVRAAVEESGQGFETLDRIGVTVGPGSFTGLRVGLAFALGLGHALTRPVVGISTLHALAWSVENGPRGPVAAVIDARRGEVYVQIFLDGVSLDEARAASVEGARGAVTDDGGPWRWAGNGAALIAPNPGPVVTEPTPLALAALTEQLDPSRYPARPLYLRAPDATPPTRLPGQARAS